MEVNLNNFISRKFVIYDKNDKLIFVSFLILIILAANIIQFSFLPYRYFRDSNLILDMVNSGYFNENHGSAFIITAKIFFYVKKIIPINSLLGWNIFLSLIFNPILLFQVLKFRKFNFFEFVLISSVFFLLNIFVFTISKEIIQFIIFYLIYIVIKNGKLKLIVKIILSSLLILIEAVFFRNYYILMFFFVGCLFVSFRISKKKIVLPLICTFVLFFAGIYVAKYISYNDYYNLLTSRDVTSAYLDANTEINNLVDINGNYILFVLNYFINLIRILFPVELITKGFLQIIFFIYQMIISIYLILSLKLVFSKKTNKDDFVLITILFAAFIFCSVTFEPDFGSFIRHETAICLFFLFMINHYKEIKEND